MYFIIPILICIAIFFLIFFHWRKKKIIAKVCEMSVSCKLELLNKLVTPLGYHYIPEQDIFSSTLDAWQKEFGYGDIYDRMSPYFNMIFDCQPIYFDYDGKTWLIEFWKGQYGINTGSEVGIYRADDIISPALRKSTIFHAVEEEDYLGISTHLRRNNDTVASLAEQHWWLTIFSLGHFSQPKELTLDITLYFPNLDMRDAFLDAILLRGYDINDFHIYYNTVSFTFYSSPAKMWLPKRLYCHYVQLKNRLFCRLYHFVTRPFTNSCDKLLYLYYYLPFAFRRMLRLRRYRRSSRKK